MLNIDNGVKAYFLFFSLSMCFKSSSGEPLYMKVFRLIAFDSRLPKETEGSACWQLLSGFVHKLPVSEVYVAATHFLSCDKVAINGISTFLDLLYRVMPSSSLSIFFSGIGHVYETRYRHGSHFCNGIVR